MYSKKEMISNYVLIKLFKSASDFKLSNGQSFLLSTEVFDEDNSVIENGDMNYMPCAGEVISVPEKLLFIQGVRHNTYMDWDTDIEIIPGDVVIVRRAAVDKAFGEKLFYVEGDHTFMFIKYDSLILAKRLTSPNSQISITKPLNGFLIISLLETNDSKGLWIPPAESQKGIRVGRVELVGSKNRAYHPTYLGNGTMDYDGTGDVADFKTGDTIAFRPESWAELESSISSVFTKEKGKKYYRVQRNRILAKIDGV